MSSQSLPRCPADGCTLPIDIVLQSSDGVQFGAHTKNLEKLSEGFPQCGSVEITSEIPELAETGTVLRLMLQSMHDSFYYGLYASSFDVVSSLAEAAEKYMIPSVIRECKGYMSNKLEDQPLEVLIYASMHDYTEIADKAAPLTLSAESKDIVAKARSAHIHDSFLVNWFRYREIHDNIY